MSDIRLDSIWGINVQMPQFPQQDGDLRTDVLIIGGGLAGLLCAWKLTDAGVNCMLIEERQIMQGVSGRTTAKISTQHGLIYDRLIRSMGKEKAYLYWRANEDALSAFGHLTENVDCDYRMQSSFLYQRDGIRKLEEEMAACDTLGIPAQWKNTLDLPFPVTGAIEFSGQAQFHPLKFAAQLSRDLTIWENTKALSYLGNGVQTTAGTITAEKIIVTTHFPMFNKHGAYYLKLYQQRSYVIALENTERVEGMYLDCTDNGLSIRSAGNWLLLGGGGHRTGKQGLGWKPPESAARSYYPEAGIEARWATQDCMTLDGLPYIGKYSGSTPNLYVATGFGKWGMSQSMVAAGVLSDLVQEKDSPYASLFSPSRSMLHGQLLRNVAESTVNLIRPTRPRCPHLGCALKWNKAERSWDCACHGSRFDEKGNVLNNPATDDLKYPPL